MAGELLLLSPRLSDAGTITGSSTVLAMPWSHLQTPYPHEVARTANLSAPFFQVDLGALYGGLLGTDLIVHVWLGGTNFRQDVTTWRIRIDDDSDPTLAPDHDSGSITASATSAEESSKERDWERGIDAYYAANIGANDLRYIRVDLADASHPDGFLEMSRLVIGLEPSGTSPRFLRAQFPVPAIAWRSQRGCKFETRLPFEQPVEDGERADGGVLYAFEREAPVESQFTFSDLDKFYLAWLRSLMRERGGGRDVVALVDPVNTNTAEGGAYLQDRTVHGYLRNVGLPRRMKTSAERYEIDFGMESIL